MLLFTSLKTGRHYFSLSFKMSNNGFFTTEDVLSFSAGKGLSFSSSRSVSNALCHGGAAIPSLHVLHMSLRDSATAVCFNVFRGRYLWDPSVWERTCAWLPIYLSLISIMHTPAVPPTVSQSLSLCCQAKYHSFI